jgi:uncharacterized protein (TIGR02145 family)
MKKYIYQTIILSFLVYAMLNISCQKLDPVAVTKAVTLTTGNISSIGTYSASIEGMFMDVGEGITSYGHCWSTINNPTIDKTEKSVYIGVPDKQVEFISQLNDLYPNTTYYVRQYATGPAGTVYSNEVSFKTPYINISAPLLGHHWMGGENHAITWNHNINGNVNVILIKNGVQNLVIASNIGNVGSFNWAVPDNITYGGLYAISIVSCNSAIVFGISQNFWLSEKTGSTGTVVNDDGSYGYKTIKIGKQWWMAENLNSTRYRNAELIGTTTNPNQDISGESNPKYQWAYDGNESNVAVNGRLYTWYAATDSRNICPTGWHVPTDAEWITIENYLITNSYNYDGSSTGNKIAKALAAATGWNTSSVTGAPGNTDYSAFRNKSGFSAFPGGYRHNTGIFYDINLSSNWWSSNEFNLSNGLYRFLYYSSELLLSSYNPKNNGFSVRCLKD